MNQKCVVVRTKLGEDGKEYLQFLLNSGEGFPTYNLIFDVFSGMKQFRWIDENNKSSFPFVHIVPEVVENDPLDDKFSEDDDSLVWIPLCKREVSIHLKPESASLLYNILIRHPYYLNISPIFEEILKEE